MVKKMACNQTLYKLPEGWKWVKLGDIVIDIKSGFSCAKRFEVSKEEGIPHLRPNNIGYFNQLNLENLVYIPKDKFDSSKYSLKKGDVLFNNTNSKELVGRAVVLKEDLENTGFSNHITRIRVKKDIILPEFLSWALNYFWVRGYFLLLCNKWIGQAGINTKMLKNLDIPIPFKDGKPDLEKQKQIVEKIEKIFNEIDKAIELRQKAINETKELFNAVLNKVFKEAEEGEGWKWVKVEDVLNKKAKFKIGKVKSKDYLKEGKYPIIDQGKNFIAGYHDDENLLYDGELPVIALGDHTLNIKYINFRFIQGADGLKILIPNKNIIYGKYLYHSLEFFKPKVKKYSRHYKIVKNLLIPIPYKDNKPDVEKQKQIANRLDNLSEKIKQLEQLQEKQLNLFKELKESILNKAFKGELI